MSMSGRNSRILVKVDLFKLINLVRDHNELVKLKTFLNLSDDYVLEDSTDNECYNSMSEIYKILI